MVTASELVIFPFVVLAKLLLFGGIMVEIVKVPKTRDVLIGSKLRTVSNCKVDDGMTNVQGGQH